MERTGKLHTGYVVVPVDGIYIGGMGVDGCRHSTQLDAQAAIVDSGEKWEVRPYIPPFDELYKHYQLRKLILEQQLEMKQPVDGDELIHVRRMAAMFAKFCLPD